MSKYLYKIIREGDKLELKKERRLELLIDEDETYIDNICIGTLCLNFFLDELENEELYCMAFDYNGCLLGMLKVSEGNHNETGYYNQKIGEFLLLMGAKSFLLCHNHPNNVLEFSEGDNRTWVLSAQLANLLDIEFSGDYVITKTGWVKHGEIGTHQFEKKYWKDYQEV